MKKQTMKTKLSLNKFKIASISNFGKSNVFGGTGNDNGDTGGPDIVRKSQVIGEDTKCADVIK
jgi:hypothetical protein